MSNLASQSCLSASNQIQRTGQDLGFDGVGITSYYATDEYWLSGIGIDRRLPVTEAWWGSRSSRLIGEAVNALDEGGRFSILAARGQYRGAKTKFVVDGLSNTMLLHESLVFTWSGWTGNSATRFRRTGGRHRQGSQNVAMCDGSVKPFAQDVSKLVAYQTSVRDDSTWPLEDIQKQLDKAR